MSHRLAGTTAGGLLAYLLPDIFDAVLRRQRVNLNGVTLPSSN